MISGVAGRARFPGAAANGRRCVRQEFREFAQECLRWAGETKSERHRQALLEMSRTWIQAALEVERGSVHQRPQNVLFLPSYRLAGQRESIVKRQRRSLRSPPTQSHRRG